jgi:hypothetical protein
LRPLGDAALRQQSGQQHRGGLGVGRGVVRANERDVVAQAQVAQAVGPEPLGVQRARQAQRAEAERIRNGDTGPPEGPREEHPVELRVVGAHDAAVEQSDQLAGDAAQPRRTAERTPRETVDVTTAEGSPRGPEEGVPPVDQGAVPGDADDADLQQPVAIGAQAAGLHVDHGEAGGGERRSVRSGHRHALHPTQGV